MLLLTHNHELIRLDVMPQIYKNELEKDWRGKDTEVATILIDMNEDTTTINCTYIFSFSNNVSFNFNGVATKYLDHYLSWFHFLDVVKRHNKNTTVSNSRKGSISKI